MEFTRDELLWIECALETELIHRKDWQGIKSKDGLGIDQDKKDISAIETILAKIQQGLRK